ncbi:phosphate/phosphite/phosphonate ABC transporter substrate-binding protein [Kaarinaea lacus]
MLVLIVFLLFTIAVESGAEERPSVFVGIVPQHTTTKLAQLWTPVLEYLSEKSGVILKFRTASSIPEFENRLTNISYDIAYMNPYHYVVFQKQSGYTAFAKQKDTRIKGIIVVRKDSSISQLADLNGRTLAFPSPGAFAASVLPRAQLRNNNIEFKAKYVISHDSVYRGVAAGVYPAGGGIYRTYHNVDPVIKEKLRVMWETDAFTPHAFAARADLSPEIIARIQQAMLVMHEDAKGKTLLEKIGFQGIEKAVDSEWDDIRALKIDSMVD